MLSSLVYYTVALKTQKNWRKTMMLHLGERVYWGAPEVIYLEGIITRLDEETQAVLVHIDRATPNSAHLIDTDVSFAADGLAPLQGESPEGIISEHSADHYAAHQMSDDEKIRCAAVVVVYQKYGNTIPTHQKEAMIEQVSQVLNSEPDMRTRIIASIDQILLRER
jgi:alpha-acetolactate decarboxylase